MTGAVTATTVLAAAAVAGTAYQIKQGRDNAKAQGRAADEARRTAAVQADQADQANNRASRRNPNAGARLEANQAAAAGGAGSTMLTGPGGVGGDSLALGKNTLLGQ